MGLGTRLEVEMEVERNDLTVRYRTRWGGQEWTEVHGTPAQ